MPKKMAQDAAKMIESQYSSIPSIRKCLKEGKFIAKTIKNPEEKKLALDEFKKYAKQLTREIAIMKEEWNEVIPKVIEATKNAEIINKIVANKRP